MLPFLQFVSDGKEYALRDIVEGLGSHFKLSESDRREMLPSGMQAAFDNRVGWARTYLKKAGLLSSPKRAVVQITVRGREVLKKQPQRIDVGFLKQFPEFMEFQTSKKEAAPQSDVSILESGQTPTEILGRAYKEMRSTLAAELLIRVRSMDWKEFEDLVVRLLVKMGYGGSFADAAEALKKGGDEGIDGIIKEDKLGLDVIYVQAKRWKADNNVGRPELQKFVGALAGQGAKKGVFITASAFTPDGLNYKPLNETKVVLIDGERLAQLMIDHDLGVAIQESYVIKRIDHDYFGEE
ncbi:MAG: restriction endonuclease [Flavobacteriales bacterium]